MKLSSQAVALVKTGYRWTPDDHQRALEPWFQRRAELLQKRALDLRSHVGWKLCNQHGRSCLDDAASPRPQSLD